MSARVAHGFWIFARGLKGCVPLAERSGYTMAESRTAVMSKQVLLRPQVTVPLSLGGGWAVLLR